MRAALAILAAFLVVGCGSARNDKGGVPNEGNPGLIVFGGVLEPGARHPPISYYALRPDGTGLRKLAFSSEDTDLGFSADARFAALSGILKGQNVIVVSRADGSERHVVPLPKDAIVSSPSLSPDGKSVALAFAPNWDNNAPSDLWTVSVDGRGLKRLASTGDVLSVAWSPDGTRIAVVDGSSLAQGSSGAIGDIYVVKADGSDLHRVARGFTGLGLEVAWSPDGTRIAFEDAKQQLAIVDVNGGKVEVVGPEGEAPAWSPDGKRLAFLRVVSCPGYVACNRARILIVDVGGGTPAREIGPKFGEPISLAWTTATLRPSAGDSKIRTPPSS